MFFLWGESTPHTRTARRHQHQHKRQETKQLNLLLLRRGRLLHTLSALAVYVARASLLLLRKKSCRAGIAGGRMIPAYCPRGWMLLDPPPPLAFILFRMQLHSQEYSCVMPQLFTAGYPFSTSRERTTSTNEKGGRWRPHACMTINQSINAFSFLLR